MGFADNVVLEQASQEYGLKAGTTFQTKSLYAGGGEFTITSDGKLVEHRYRYEDDPTSRHSVGHWGRSKRVHVGDTVIDYHGDILLHGVQPDYSPKEFVARFTHGRVEWIRPAEEYPEENRRLLVEQGTR
jgi:hypothetical protein